MYQLIKDREITLDEIISKSWSLYTRQFKAILLITLVIYVPINIILQFVNVSVDTMKDFKLYLNVIRILEAFFGIIATMGIAVVIENSIQNPEDTEVNWKEALSRAFSRWGSCIGTNFLAGLIILGFTLLLVVPGLIWALYYVFTVEIVVLRNLSGKTALNYSKSLVKGRWWKVFGIFLVIGIIYIIPSSIIGAVSGFLPGGLTLFTDTFIDIISAFGTVASTVFFLNLDYEKNRQNNNIDALNQMTPDTFNHY